jgi:Cu2+-exporting ATPase
MMQASIASLPFNSEVLIKTSQAWEALDDQQEWTEFSDRVAIDPKDDRWTSQVMVGGMRCTACGFSVEAVLRALPGVLEAQVNPASRRARIVWVSTVTKPSVWFEACAAAGYPLLPASPTSVHGENARELRTALWRWLVSGLCMMQVMMYAYPAYIARPGEMSSDALELLRWASWVLTLPVMLFCCGPFFRSAWRDLRAGRISMELPVAFGVAITFVVSTAATFDPNGSWGQEVYFDSLTMFVFFLLTGRWLEAKLKTRTAGALDALLHRLPDSVERLSGDERWQRVSPRQLVVGDIVRVWPGEAFPADGLLVDGDTSADEALLSGESRPVPRGRGDCVLAGSHNISAPVKMRVERVGAETRFANIVRLMERAALEKPRLVRLADRFAYPFLWGVLVSAAVAAALWWSDGPGKALMVAVSVLVVTCPCALSLATPAAMLASAGALARAGVLTANLQSLETLASIDTVVFDKTGTLTTDTPQLERVYCRRGLLPGDALEIGAALGSLSLHPAARALVNAWSAQFRNPPQWELSGTLEMAGQGVQASRRRANSKFSPNPEIKTRLGSATFCTVQPLQIDGMQIHLTDDQGWMASFVLSENLRADAAQAVVALKRQGISVRMLSGDQDASARRAAARAGIAAVQGECTPEEKLNVLWRLQAEGRRVVMIGDGLNDGPSLARADASFAFGESVPMSRAKADFVVLGDELIKIPDAMAQARRTLQVIRQNLAWAAGYNAICVPVAIVGWLPAWLAGLGMAASSLAVLLNASRLALARQAKA